MASRGTYVNEGTGVRDMQKNDVIYRQAAVDIVDFECGEWRGLAKTIIKKLEALHAVQPERVCVATVTLTDEQVKEAVEKAKNAVISVIEPEPHWIPCSERLPKKTGYYLTTNEYKVVHEDYYWGSGCFEKAKKYQCEVVAWMPMPIPPYYGGGN